MTIWLKEVQAIYELQEAINESPKFVRQCLQNIDEDVQRKIVESNGNLKLAEAIFRETQFPKVRELILNKKCPHELVDVLVKFKPPDLSEAELEKLCFLEVRYMNC